MENITSSKNETGLHTTLRRKSSGQVVTFHEKRIKSNNKIEDEHYHWFELKTFEDQIKESKNKNYRDCYGNLCKIKSRESHLAPYDKDYNYK